MALLLASIPLMVLGVAIAVVPLLWSIAHETRRQSFVRVVPDAAEPESALEKAS